jgi:hypothetical protein
MTSSNPATNGGGGMGVMENLMAMQSVQAIQSILSSKEGWTKQNLISFAVVSFSDTIKRLLNSSVDSLIQSVHLKMKRPIIVYEDSCLLSFPRLPFDARFFMPCI